MQHVAHRGSDPATASTVPVPAKALAELLDAARLAAARFREYEAHHAAKPDPDKAARNRELAELLEATLAPFAAKPAATADTLREIITEALTSAAHVKKLVVSFKTGEVMGLQVRRLAGARFTHAVPLPAKGLARALCLGAPALVGEWIDDKAPAVTCPACARLLKDAP